MSLDLERLAAAHRHLAQHGPMDMYRDRDAPGTFRRLPSPELAMALGPHGRRLPKGTGGG